MTRDLAIIASWRMRHKLCRGEEPTKQDNVPVNALVRNCGVCEMQDQRYFCSSRRLSAARLSVARSQELSPC